MVFRKPSTKPAVPERPDRLFRDLQRRKHASLFDHQGQILRTYVDEALQEPDVALQLPTGSGKTLVGLLLAEWRRRKYGERVVYLCPTRQLVNQVADEASSKYGLTVEPFTGKIANYGPEARAAYENTDRVAVTTYSSLFNTNPFFSTPEIVVLDDAHASENYIASQWTLQIRRFKEGDETLFRAVAGVLKGVVKAADYQRLTGDSNSPDDITWVDKIPTPQLARISGELRAVITENIGDGEHKYPWRMIGDHLDACQVYISSSEILIRPLIPPTWAHAPFNDAKQRIFMSATLGAGGDLERLTGRPKIRRLAIPEGWDRQGIGRRLFVFPEMSLHENEVTVLRRELMKAAGRSLVLTPSDTAAQTVVCDVDSVLQYPIYSGEDLESRKAEFVNAHPAVAIVANRYDGIDLPDDDCRLLFVEGLPQTVNLQERFLLTRMGSKSLFNERIQTRVLQALGRCTRGLNDFSAVVVTGEHLPAYLTDHRRRSHFHPELQAELEFGIEQSTQVDIANILDNFRIFLEHEEDWEEANEAILQIRAGAAQSEFPGMSDLEGAVADEITWQRAMWGGDYAEAFEAARGVLGTLNDPTLRGYRALWHYLGGSAARLAVDDGEQTLETHARVQFQKAKDASFGITWLIGLARGGDVLPTGDEKDQATVMRQVERLEAYLQNLGTLHNRRFSAREKEIRTGLRAGDGFESAHALLGQHLGFEAGNQESDASPDPWWRVAEIALVFEDHANAGKDVAISASKARQAASHPNWMREHVAGAAAGIIQPVLLTPAKKVKEGAVPHLSDVAYWGLDEFREWAEVALDTVREIRRTFNEPGDLAWRAVAATQLENVRADAPGLVAWLSGRPARNHLTVVK